ncbi:MAG: DNA polymerase III subunit delta' [Thermodesulfobacteriota bacterium]|nr:DNA polymerase III subunit delta' [Thermodesulfobacteriota bacterium]
MDMGEFKICGPVKNSVNRQVPADISGQERPIRVFGRMMKKGLLAHAYLLVGTPGAGKEALAFSFAKLLLCEKPYLGEDLPSPCGSCSGCIKFEHQAHPDLVILRPQGTMIKLDQIRDLQRALSFSPLDSQHRVCLILEAQKINLPAANALLKTLEEPPAGNHLILTATSTKTLLPTIVSRCQVIHCECLSVSALMERIKEERLCPSDSAQFLACFSEGSILKAKDLLEQNILSVRENLLEFLKSNREKALFMLFVLSKRISNKRESILLAVQIIRTFLRDLMILKGLQGEDRKEQKEPGVQIFFNPDYENELQAISHRFGFQDLAEYCQWLDKMEWLLDRNISREFMAESALIFWIRKRR